MWRSLCRLTLCLLIAGLLGCVADPVGRRPLAGVATDTAEFRKQVQEDRFPTAAQSGLAGTGAAAK